MAEPPATSQPDEDLTICNVTRKEFEQLKADVESMKHKLNITHTTAYNAIQAVRRGNGGCG